MLIMKGYTSSLTLLLFVNLFFGAKAQAPPGGEPAPTDYLPAVATQILLPTTAGTFDPTKVKSEYGQFSKAYSTCGKNSVVGNTDLGVSFKDSFEMRLECHPHPMRVVFSTAAGKLGDVQPAALAPNECQGLQLCKSKVVFGEVPHGTATKTIDNAELNKLEAGDDLCPDNTNDQILFSNEMGCKNPDGGVKGFDEITEPDVFVHPRWQTNEDGLFEVLRSFTYSGKGKKSFPTIPRTNSFVDYKDTNTPPQPHQWKKCTAACDRGRIVKINMKRDGGWKTTIYLKGKTKGFKVCINADGHDTDTVTPKCNPLFELFILPRNGVVIWPKSGRASMIELKSPSIGDDQVYAIEFGFGYGKQTDPNAPTQAEFYVANMYREVVTSDSDGYGMAEASKLSFFFEDEDSLAPSAGIFSQQLESGRTYIDATKPVQDFAVINPKAGVNVAAGGESLIPPSTEPTLPLIVTTTPASVRLSSNAQAAVLLLSTDNTNDAIYMPGKWWAWGIYIGFIIGSIVGVAIIGGIFYVLRRTVYGFWYRGMYKRYGCDASGTTGGITGVGFGNTTTGAITVGGTTGGGGTTTGRTGGTTGSTTRTGGGGTTGSQTSTGGASTIAM